MRRALSVVVVLLLVHKRVEAQGFLWTPLSELTITCDFCGYHAKSGSCHNGIDFRARQPIHVYAAASGQVEYVQKSHLDRTNLKAGYGNHVIIVHSNGYRTLYAHLTKNSISVTVGDEVVVGQQIALTDTSGAARGPHLHFEVRNPQGQRVDPYGDPTDQNKCLPEDQNIPHTCGQSALWATCPPTPYMMPPPPDAAVSDGTVVWPDGPLPLIPDAAFPDGPVVWPDGMMVWPDGPVVIPDASVQPDSSVLADVSIDGPVPAPDAAILVPDAGISDPCTGITCATPPNPYCMDAWVLRTQTSPGVCSAGICTYPYFETSCSEGCQNGECLANPCTGVICENPPVPYCLNNTTRRTYASQGVCVDGTCSYNTSDTVCTDGNSCTADACANSACAYSAVVPCCGNSACEGSETVCSCPADCAPWCGDGCCSGTETCLNCEDDCGCSSSEVCLNDTESCGTDSTPTTTSYRFVNLCTSAHWQSIGEPCYPGASGPNQGCGGCGATIINSGCSSATCWDRELSFSTYLLEPNYGQFSQIFHCFENGANSYSRSGCASYGDPTSIGWIADAPVGEWTRPLYLCQWFTGIVTEQFFSWDCSQEAGGGNPVTTLNPSPYGYVPW